MYNMRVDRWGQNDWAHDNSAEVLTSFLKSAVVESCCPHVLVSILFEHLVFC